ncbi:uncharacterized protein GGS25DRAFT_521317 [Hypoxylon fragiforme]|uniref:uncharacterized protein n=1 Tax=Hypoxylon fragiforme TaxID=63214 RepID=UPI0020C5B96A|nr:uncharacterized protein GGS25DRAFT_521317 [Hypoxylon fragiforme]KAI2608146.1 hypothetical protein GGS25DRAFT_521317 [Hypoxylon fragiforme]
MDSSAKITTPSEMQTINEPVQLAASHDQQPSQDGTRLQQATALHTTEITALKTRVAILEAESSSMKDALTHMQGVLADKVSETTILQHSIADLRHRLDSIYLDTTTNNQAEPSKTEHLAKQSMPIIPKLVSRHEQTQKEDTKPPKQRQETTTKQRIAPGMEKSRHAQIAPGMEKSRHAQVAPGMEKARYSQIAPGMEKSRHAQTAPSMDQSRNAQIAAGMEKSRHAQATGGLASSRHAHVGGGLAASRHAPIATGLAGSRHAPGNSQPTINAQGNKPDSHSTSKQPSHHANTTEPARQVSRNQPSLPSIHAGNKPAHNPELKKDFTASGLTHESKNEASGKLQEGRISVEDKPRPKVLVSRHMYGTATPLTTGKNDTARSGSQQSLHHQPPASGYSHAEARNNMMDTGAAPGPKSRFSMLPPAVRVAGAETASTFRRAQPAPTPTPESESSSEAQADGKKEELGTPISPHAVLKNLYQQASTTNWADEVEEEEMEKQKEPSA